jgi:hypothetical protein
MKLGGSISTVGFHDEKIKRFAAGSEFQAERGQRLEDRVAFL